MAREMRGEGRNLAASVDLNIETILEIDMR